MALSQEFGLGAALRTGVLPMDAEALKYIPAGFAARHDVLPYGIDGSDLLVAVPDDEPSTVDRVRLLTGMRVRATVYPRPAIRTAARVAYGDVSERHREDESSAPAVRLVDDIHDHAVRAEPSDIHLEPGGDGGRVRQRVDGRLVPYRVLDRELYAQVVARIKLLAGLDVADRRQPQDGRYSFADGGAAIDVRVSSISTIDGERLVLRLFDASRQRPSLTELGMDAATVRRCQELVRATHGFVIVCGPTGSGKTTTLYAALDDRRSEREHLCTIEDPIEIRMSGIAQVQVNVRAGMTFARALRAVLRQDPDVIMIGELRDAETASIAASAALSGQLVLATMHSFDVVSAIVRLGDLGIERHAVAAALTGVIAQRLMRTTCTSCGSAVPQCSACGGTRWRGRTGMFACVTIGAELRSAIADGASSQQLARIVEREDGSSLARDGLRHVMAGRTSAAEVQRVLGEYAGE